MTYPAPPHPISDAPLSPLAPPRVSDGLAEPEVTLAYLAEALAPGYQLIRPIGAGGMGSVYLARDPQLKRLVAVKLLAPHLVDDPAARARFTREAQAVAAIAHPNVVAIYGAGALPNGTPYFIMQYVHGTNVADWLQSSGPSPVAVARRVLGEVASGLAAAHARGVIHRDVKASNVLIDEETGRALVSDFGIAAVVAADGAPDAPGVTQPGQAIGTPTHMSPEQLMAAGVTDKSDVYNLGVLGYELLSGRGPYDVYSPGELFAAHLRDAPVKLRERRADTPEDLATLLEWCLAKNPNDRPTASEAANRLTNTSGELLEWPPPGLEALQGAALRPTRRFGLGVWLLVAAIAAAMIFELRDAAGLALFDILLLAPATVGAVLTAMALRRLINLRRLGARAADAGHTFAVILEVLADNRHNGGALIAGTEEFAGLSASTRNRLRIRRVVGLAAVLLSALAPLIMLVIAVPGPRGGNELLFAVEVFLPGLMLNALVGRFKLYERSLAPRGRRRELPELDGDLITIVASWQRSFNRVRAEQSYGGGWRAGEIIHRGLGIFAWVLIGLSAIVTSFMLVATFNVAVNSPFSLVISSSGYREAMSASGYRATRNPRVSAEQAGQIIYDVSRFGLTGLDRDTAGYRPPSKHYDERWLMPRSSPFHTSGGGWVDGEMIERAFAGLSLPEHAFLEAFSRHPALADLRVAGHASDADVEGAMLGQTLPNGLNRSSGNSLPSLRTRPLQAAITSLVAAAALQVANGRADTAEVMLREAMNIGFLVMNGRTWDQTMSGSAIILGARDGLRVLYQHRRPQEAQSLMLAGMNAATSFRADRANAELSRLDTRTARVLISDRAIAPSARWDYLSNLADEQCVNLHARVFGSEEWEGVVRQARATLPRFPAEREELDFITRSGRWSTGGGSRWSLMRLPLWLFDHLTGGTRFQACAF